MSKGRLEAFTDGVIAILITIMVLDLRPPHEASWAAIAAVLPTFETYILSFLILAIYWNNHHHMLHLADRADGAILWANLNLLFWLSLVPFLTGWMGDTHFERLPTMAYGVDLLLCGASYTILQNTIIRSQGKDSPLKATIGIDVKGWLSVILYSLAVVLALVDTLYSGLLFLAVALMWLLPDRRIEKRVKPRGSS